MFSALGDLVAPPRESDEEEVEGSENEQEEASGSTGPALSFWGMASALRESVKQRTAELAESLKETDWRKELGAFQQGLKEDSEELQHKTKAAVDQLPTVVEQLKSEKAGAVIQARAKEAQQQLQQAGKQLGTYGHKLLVGTSDLFDQIKEAVQNEMAFEGPSEGGVRRMPSKRQLASAQGAKFSRFEADVSAMQRDSSTYCDEPEDEDDYAAWLETFKLEAKKPDIEALIAGNTFMAELQARIVPLIVEYDAFWTRYFYRLHKLQQKHEQFVQLTQRANQQDEEVELGWGSDDEQQGIASPRAAPGASHKGRGGGEGGTKDASQDANSPTPEGTREAPAAPAPAKGQGEEGQATAAGGVASPTLSEDGAAAVSTASEVSQGSGGTPERWTVVSSPTKAQDDQQHQQQQEGGSAEAAEAAEGAAVSEAGAPADTGKGEAIEKAVGPAPDAPTAPAQKTNPAAASSNDPVAGPAAAVAAVASVGHAAPRQPAPVAEAKPASAAKKPAASNEEGSDLSDFDVDGEEAGVAGDVDEDWGDDWE
ncbi:hypothetical protein N2152v2_001781 [Parachlorella kessleri]